MENENIINEAENMQDSSSGTIQPETSLEPETSTENESVNNDSKETDIDASETVSDSSGDNHDKDITERLDELISILTPEDNENETSTCTVSGNSIEVSSDGSSSGSEYNESFDNINDALALIKSENAAYYKDSLYVQENIHRELQHISFIAECTFAISAVVGFLVALHVGGKLADYFFGKMKR